MAKKGDKDAIAVGETESKRLTPDKVELLFRSAENWTDIRSQLVNINYFVGNQWITWNSAERRIMTLPLASGEVRVKRNKIRSRVMALLAKHIKNKLKYDVVPGSKEQVDIDAAKAADKYLHALWQELDFGRKTKDLFLYMLIQKRGWIKTWYDDTAGDEISPSENDPGYEEWVKGGSKPIHQGVIRARVCDPLTVFSDPAATCEDEIRWIIERKARDVDEIFEEYGKRVSPDANVGYLNRYDITRMSADGIGAYEITRMQNQALVYELWYKPCKRYPEGVKITVCNGVELDYSEASGELPYQLFGYIPIPGSNLYDAIVTDMLDPQREINTMRSMIATHARRMGNAMWLNPIGSGVDEEELTNEISGIIDYNPVAGAKPERVDAPDIPSFYGQELANNAIDIDDSSGAREVSQGRMPAGLDTLGGLEIMVEQENEKLAVAAQNYEQGMKKVMQRILRLVKAHYTEERQARLVGEDNEIEIISFNGSDLTGFEDVNIVQGSSLPEMKAAQQERIMTMWGAGAIVKKDGTPDHTKLLRLMGMGDSTELFEQDALDSNNAKMENKTFEDLAEDQEFMQALEIYQMQMQQFQATAQQAMQTGNPAVIADIQQMMPQPPPGIPQIWDSDNDDIHIEIHNTFRKTSRYRQMSPAMRDVVDQHYQQHLDRINAPMMAQQQAQMQAQQQEAEQKTQDRQAQVEMKQMDQQSAIARDALKAETQLATAAMRR
ncbi:portal protein [Paenibacillus sp. CAU 1782]